MNTFVSFSVVGILVLILVTLVDPFMYWMPSMVQMVLLTLGAALLIVLSALVLREGGGDERDVLHRMLAGRAAFLTGIAILTIALLYQGFTHAIDPWVPIVLLGMVLAKFIARFYADKRL